VRFYLNREAWQPRHWVVLVACVATGKVADVASDHGWWFWVAIVPPIILLKFLPHDFIGLKRRHRVPKDQETGWEALITTFVLGAVALVLTAWTLDDYLDTSELRAHGVIAPRPGTVTLSTTKNDNQDIEVSFTTQSGSHVTATVGHFMDPQPAVGDRIAVRYSPTDPETMAVASYPMSYIYVVIGGVLSAVMWIMVAFCIRWEYRTRG